MKFLDVLLNALGDTPRVLDWIIAGMIGGSIAVGILKTVVGC